MTLPIEVGQRVKIIELPGKDTPRGWIGRIGTLVAMPILTHFRNEEREEVLTGICAFKVEDDNGVVGDFYYLELQVVGFKSTDYELVPNLIHE